MELPNAKKPRCSQRRHNSERVRVGVRPRVLEAMSGLPPTAQARVKACAASVAIILIGYTAVSVITDRSRLQKALNEQAAAL